MKRKPLTLILTIFLLAVFPAVALAGSAILHWQPNSDPDLAGYRIYYGTAHRSYGPYIPVDASTTSYTLNGLVEGRTYYFALTAVDTSGNESGYSEEVQKNIVESAPAPAPAPVPAPAPAPPSDDLDVASSPPTSDQIDQGPKKESPTLDIKVNGKHGTLIVTKATPIRITVSLKPGDYAGQDADWWVYGGTSESGEYSFIYGTGWISGKHLSYRGRIFDLASFTVADGKLPVGNYLITFAIDNNADGRRDNTWKDSIRIIVTQGTLMTFQKVMIAPATDLIQLYQITARSQRRSAL